MGKEWLGRLGLSNVGYSEVQAQLEVHTCDLAVYVFEVINLGTKGCGPVSRPEVLVTVRFAGDAYLIDERL